MGPKAETFFEKRVEKEEISLHSLEGGSKVSISRKGKGFSS